MIRPALTFRRDVAALVGLALGAALSACPLPANVRYRCEPGGTCAQEGFLCASDGYCYPTACTPRDTTSRCAEVECGLVSDGCGRVVDCGKWCPEGFECGVTAANTCARPRLCTASGWCWENPLPQGATLYSAYRADERNMWFVGELATVLRFDGEKSRLEALPVDTPATFHGVHGTGRDDVYVVGSDGLIFHYDGTAWAKEGLANGVPSRLRAVAALANGLAVAVGDDGRAVVRNPSAPADRRWQETSSGVVEALVDVVALADGGVRAVTNRGAVLALVAEQGRWSSAGPGAPPLVYNDGTNQGARTLAERNGRLYVGGSAGGSRVPLYRLDDDGGWTGVTDAGRDVLDTFALGDELWAVGPNFVTRLTAEDVSDPPLGLLPGTAPGGTTVWHAGVPLKAGEALVGGYLGLMAVARPEAGQLLMRSQGSLRDVNAVCGLGAATLYGASTVETPWLGCGGGNCRPRILDRVVTSAGAYWHFSDMLQLGGTTELLACYAFGPNRIWLMGNDSKFFLQSGATWEYGDFGNTGITGAYISGWGLPDAGYLFLRDGEQTVNESPTGNGNWNEVSVPSQGQPLNGVWGLSGTDKILVGGNGLVTRWKGTQWDNPLATGVTDELLAVHGTTLAAGGQRYVAAGVNGRVVLLDSSDAITTQALGTSLRLTSAWTSAFGKAWVVGYFDEASPRAFIASQAAPGSPFTPDVFPADRQLRTVFGVDLPDGGVQVWLGGEGGLLLRHGGP